MPERRFRDMRLTVGDIEHRVGEHFFKNYAPGYPTEEHATNLEDRAKRLLTLWRDIGLRELAGGSYDKPVLGAAQRIISVMNSRKDR